MLRRRAQPSMAYLRVHSLAVDSKALGSSDIWRAISHTSGSAGLGSESSEESESSSLDTDRIGDHSDLRMSRQMPPLLLMLQW